MVFTCLPLLPETTDGLGKGIVLLGSSRDVPGLAPSAIKESGSCCEILAFGPLVPGADFPLSMTTNYLNKLVWLFSHQYRAHKALNNKSIPLDLQQIYQFPLYSTGLLVHSRTTLVLKHCKSFPDLVQMQEACADIKCSSPHQICRGSNPCYNKCSSQFCPAYLEYACFCESEAEVEVSLDFDIQKSQTYLKCCRHLIIAFRKKYSEDGKTNLDVAKDLVLKKHSVKRRKDAYLQAKKELP
ncbi:hypothetical protein HUJ04_010156 [Dendroctonus ponderosae]|nr:hypothetical protein HUJ04_010156 [Dendroctonus ponderosae]